MVTRYLTIPPTIYLAGAIRDGHDEDWQWREQAINRLGDRARILNPMGGKEFNPTTGIWTMSGIVSSASKLFKHDCWCVDQSDIIIANFSSLSSGYPSIGTLVEFGRATAGSKLIYTIVADNYSGHENPALYKLHPFLSEASSAVFNTVDECLNFVGSHLKVLTGAWPHFSGVANVS